LFLFRLSLSLSLSLLFSYSLFSSLLSSSPPLLLSSRELGGRTNDAVSRRVRELGLHEGGLGLDSDSDEEGARRPVVRASTQFRGKEVVRDSEGEEGTEASTQPQGPRTLPPGLFDDLSSPAGTTEQEDDEDEDVFAPKAKSKSKANKASKPSKASKVSKAKDKERKKRASPKDSDSDDYSGAHVKKRTKTKPAGRKPGERRADDSDEDAMVFSDAEDGADATQSQSLGAATAAAAAAGLPPPRKRVIDDSE
jgi:hypothetical protein